MMEERASRTSEHGANYFPWQAVTWQAGSASAISPEVSETKRCTNKAGHDLFGMIGSGADSWGKGALDATYLPMQKKTWFGME